MNRWTSDIRIAWQSLGKEGSFVRNSAWMFTSSGVSILIQFLFFPILSRIYTPEVYGLFGVFNFYTVTLGNALTLGYNQAYVLPETESQFLDLLKLSIRIPLILTSVASIIALFWGPEIMLVFGHAEVGNWVYLIAPVAFLMALDRITADWAIREREFRRQTFISTGVTAFTKGFNTAYGWLLSASVGGLIWTTVLQHGLRALFYLIWVIPGSWKKLAWKPASGALSRVAREYREFPLFIYWGNVLSIFSGTLPAALLPWLGFGLEAVGQFTYALIIHDLPVRMLGAGISSVYLQKSAELSRDRPHELAPLTWKLFRGMALVCSVFAVVVALIAEPMYAFVFGEPWRQAGQVAEWLVIYSFMRMITSPLTALFNTLRREKQFFAFQAALTIVRAVSLIGGAIVTSDFVELMIIFSIANGAMYAGLAFYIFSMTGISWKRGGSLLAGCVGGATGVIFLLKWVIS